MKEEIDYNKGIEDMLKAVSEGRIKPGSVVAVNILHDDDCPALRSRTPTLDCRCEPDYESRTFSNNKGS